MKEDKSAPCFQSGWSRRPGTVDWRWGRGTWANSHFTETSLWHLDKSAMWQSVEGNSGAMMKAVEERKTQRC